MYMIGRTEDTASPIILVCSKDKATRRNVRRTIKESEILWAYPGIGLGETAELPDHRTVQQLGGEGLDWSRKDREVLVRQLEVYTDSRDQVTIGRSLYAAQPDGSVVQLATGGPLLYLCGRTFQLSVGHAFTGQPRKESSPTEQSSAEEDFEFDNMSDEDEAADSGQDSEVTSIGSVTPNSMRLLGRSSIGSHNEPTNLASNICLADDMMEMESQNSRVGGTEYRSTENTSTYAMRLRGALNRFNNRYLADRASEKPSTSSIVLKSLGFLAITSDGHEPSLDYSLVEVDAATSPNMVEFSQVGKLEKITVSCASTIGCRTVEVITRTASAGVLSGKLYSNASYLRLPDQRTFQEVYPVQFDGTLRQGDCGAPVLDQMTGDFYGHVVAGTPGSGWAYIISAIQILRDITERCINETPPRSLELAKRWQKPSRSAFDIGGYRNHDVTEFGSDEYIKAMETEQTWSGRGREQQHGSQSPSHFTTVHLDNDSHVPMSDGRDNFEWLFSRPEEKQQRSRSLGYHTGKDSISTLSLQAPSRLGLISRMKSTKNGLQSSPNAGDTASSDVLNLDMLLRFLPVELQIHIIGFLHLPDVLSLRLTSRYWCNWMAVNEISVARKLLRYIPPEAIRLYQLPSGPDVDLAYILGLWHRLLVVTEYSSLLCQWITRELFVRRTVEQQLQFAMQAERMRRRLSSVLLTVLHFFENYRQLSLREHNYNHTNHAELNPIELQIMRGYDDASLLAVREMFPLIVSSFCRHLRVPAYIGGLERSLRGYSHTSPGDEVYVAIMCIGGLRQMLRFWKIGGYNARIGAATQWYAALLNDGDDERMSRSTLLRQGFLRLIARKQADLASLKTKHSEATIINRNQKATEEAESTGRTESRNSGLIPSSLSRGSLMEPSTSTGASQILQSLPRLQELGINTAEALLLERGVIKHQQDIKKNQQVLIELIRDKVDDMTWWCNDYNPGFLNITSSAAVDSN
jgi:hypothetical protein